MTLSAGSRLGPYEFLSPLGAGGMGEVYRARETKLEREVAIKVLPAAISEDPRRRQRFEQEARAASGLNHPAIVTIYEIGSADGVTYIAMELVDGLTLRELLAGGPISPRKLLEIGAQAADGLAKAHAAGIVHRDLKPENLMITKDGFVKILDFGLAKLSETQSHHLSELPTAVAPPTEPGTVLGTVGYMSPEQAMGKTVDYRSDQFALGAILYEMATGRRAFARSSAPQTLAAIIQEDPEPIASLNPKVPAPLRWVIERCLSKEPRQRYSSTDDLARDLATLRDHFSEAVSGVDVAAGTAARWQRITRAILGGVAGAVALFAAGVFGERWFASRGTRTDVPSFRRLTFRRGHVLNARFAPDGRTIVYGAAWEGAPGEIFATRTDSIEPRPLGFRADVMAVSSKGEVAILLNKMLPFRGYGEGTLARIPLGGGTPREILERVDSADWAPNGEDLAVTRRLPNGKAQIEYPIGTVLGEFYGWALRVSPKGDLVAFSQRLLSEKGLAITTIDRKGKSNVISRRWRIYGSIVWSPRGDELIFTGSRSENDWAIRAVSLSGRERVLVPFALGYALHDVAPDGRLLIEKGVSRFGIACKPRGETRERELSWFDGSLVQKISEDGKLILFSERGYEAPDPNGIYLRRTDGEAPVRLGNGTIQDLSTDGHWVLTLQAGPPPELVLLPTGPGTPKKIPLEVAEPLAASLLQNGKGFIVVARGESGSVNPVFLLGPDGGKPRPVRSEGRPRHCISPDEDRIVSIAGEGQLKIIRLSGGEVTTVPATPLERNEVPVQWSADSKFLYIVRYEVPARVDRLDLASGRRELWKQLMPEDPAGIISIDTVVIARDGQSYAYSYDRDLASDLYVVEGLK